MVAEQDSWMRRLAKKNVADWTSRAKIARESGNTELLKKALKYQARYELERIETLLMESDEEPLASGPVQLEQADYCMCSLFDGDPGLPDEEFDAVSFTPDLARKVVVAMGVTMAELEAMETGFIELLNFMPVCDKCRSQHDKMLSVLHLLRKAEERGQ